MIHKFKDWLNESVSLLDNLIVKVNNIEEYQTLMNYLDKLGYHWGDNKLASSKDYFNQDYAKGPGYCVRISSSDRNDLGYSDLNFYKSSTFSDYIIIDFKDLNLDKNFKRVERPDVDPFNEDDWGYEEI